MIALTTGLRHHFKGRGSIILVRQIAEEREVLILHQQGYYEERIMVTQIETTRHPAKTVRYLRGHPLVGNLPDYTKERLGLLKRMAREDDVCGMHFGPFPAILFNKPEHVHSILVEHAYDFDKGLAIHHVFRPVIGDGIFSSEGDFHRHQRKLMAPPFQPRHIAGYADVMGQY